MFVSHEFPPLDQSASQEESRQLSVRQQWEDNAQFLETRAKIKPRERGFPTRQLPDASQTLSAEVDLVMPDKKVRRVEIRLGLYDQPPESDIPTSSDFGGTRAAVIWKRESITRNKRTIDITRLMGWFEIPPVDQAKGELSAVCVTDGFIFHEPVPINHPKAELLKQAAEATIAYCQRQQETETTSPPSTDTRQAVGAMAVPQLVVSELALAYV